MTTENEKAETQSPDSPSPKETIPDTTTSPTEVQALPYHNSTGAQIRRLEGELKKEATDD